MISSDPKLPRNDLPLLPPAVDIETRPILKACIEARAAIAALKVAGTQIPDQTVLINTLPVLEAQASSAIENIVTTSDALFRYAQMADPAADPTTKEAALYRVGLMQGLASIRTRPLSTNTAVEVCSGLKGMAMEIRRLPGTTITNQATGELIYTPPEGESRIRDLLANWERFIHEAQDIDPLIRMAVAHYQFEAIHPFLDGNGRTGRILNLLMLVQLDLLDQPVLYLSRAILRSRSDYYRLLNDVTRNGNWEAWILYMLAALASTARWTTGKVDAIRQLKDQARAHVRVGAPKLYTHELVDIIFQQPYCRIQNLVDAGIAKRQTASVYLKGLERIGVLTEVPIGRDKLFVHPAFLKLLTSEEHEVPAYGQ